MGLGAGHHLLAVGASRLRHAGCGLRVSTGEGGLRVHASPTRPTGTPATSHGTAPPLANPGKSLLDPCMLPRATRGSLKRCTCTSGTPASWGCPNSRAPPLSSPGRPPPRPAAARTPLHYASSLGHVDCIRALLGNPLSTRPPASAGLRRPNTPATRWGAGGAGGAGNKRGHWKQEWPMRYGVGGAGRKQASKPHFGHGTGTVTANGSVSRACAALPQPGWMAQRAPMTAAPPHPYIHHVGVGYQLFWVRQALAGLVAPTA